MPVRRNQSFGSFDIVNGPQRQREALHSHWPSAASADDPADGSEPRLAKAALSLEKRIARPESTLPLAPARLETLSDPRLTHRKIEMSLTEAESD
jgi:hypothetical protein